MKERRSDREIAYPPRPRPDAGLYRRAGGRRPGGNARCHHPTLAAIPASSIPRYLSTWSLTIPSWWTFFGGPDSPSSQECGYASMSATASAIRIPALGPGGVFSNFRVVPPGTGICHQVNLEYLSQTVWTRDERVDGTTVITYAYPDTLVGTDSHTTMGQRPVGSRLGRWRYRGRSGDARPADLHAYSGSDRLQADRQACPTARLPPTLS